MRTEKRNNYALTGGVHTLEVKANRDALIPIEERPPWLSNCIRGESSSKKEPDKVKLIINPNRFNGDIYGVTLFTETFNRILESLGIYSLDDFSITRADFRLDSFSAEHYHAFSKLNRLLISMLAVTYAVKNCYRTCDLFTQQQLSIAVKNRDFEIENYDKNSESHGMDLAQSRLEERSKRGVDYDLEVEFVKNWRHRWKKAFDNLDAVYAKYNEALADLYLSQKDSKPTRWRTATDFILQHQDCIFCKKQLVNLLERIGVGDAKKKATNLKKNYKLEFFSKSDVSFAISEIMRATEAFFSDEEVRLPTCQF